MSVTNRLLSLLGVFLIPQPFVHVPDTHTHRNKQNRFTAVTNNLEVPVIFPTGDERQLPQQLQLSQETILLFLDVLRHTHHVPTVKQTKEESVFFCFFVNTSQQENVLVHVHMLDITWITDWKCVNELHVP